MHSMLFFVKQSQNILEGGAHAKNIRNAWNGFYAFFVKQSQNIPEGGANAKKIRNAQKKILCVFGKADIEYI